MIFDVAVFLEPIKDRGTLPRTGVDFALHGVGEYARNIFHETAPGDVRHPLDGHFLHGGEHLLDVDAGGFHRAVGERGAVKGHVPVGARDFHYLADQGETVGVGA